MFLDQGQFNISFCDSKVQIIMEVCGGLVVEVACNIKAS